MIIYKSSEIETIHLESTDSTNSWAKRECSRFRSGKIYCVVADAQTAGRGRLGRKWVSPEGKNLYASVVFTLPLSVVFLPNLGQILILSAAKVLEQLGFDPKIKWPNDLLLDGKKVAGVLSEATTCEDHLVLIMGVGLNLNMTLDELAAIDQPATSLFSLTEKTWSRDDILKLILNQFVHYLNSVQVSGFEPLHPAFEKFLAHKGKKITVHDGLKTIEGICEGIAPDGRLKLKISTGETLLLSAAEITKASS